jgi:hypothetical protein
MKESGIRVGGRTSAARAVAFAALFGAASDPLASGQTVTRGPYLQSGGQDRVTICWRTDVACDSVVNFGDLPGQLSQQVTDSSQVTNHAITLAALGPNHRYYYSIGTSSAVLAGDDLQHTFLTAPPAGRSRRGRFWILGDSGTKDGNARAVRDAFLAWNAGRPIDGFLMLGDNAYNSGNDGEYQDAVFQNMYESRLIDSVLWPAYGNHDALSADSGTQSGVYYDIFRLPKNAECGGVASGTEAYWSFDWGNAHFICLDSMESDRLIGGPMLSWLEQDLLANTREWVIAFWHHPPYSKGSHDSDNDSELIEMRLNAVKKLEEHGVDLVLSGHSHSYERSYLVDGHYGKSFSFDPLVHGKDMGDGRMTGDGAYLKPGPGMTPREGAVYVVSGASGKTANGPFDHAAMHVAFETLGSFVIDFAGAQLDAAYLDSTGKVVDRFTLVKGGATPVGAAATILLPKAANWGRFDLGYTPASDWFADTYDDSAWAGGDATLGYGESYITTVVSYGNDPNNKHITTYFRVDFDLAADPFDVTALRLDANYDDGFVAYLNGTEVVRSPSMPSGTITFSTKAGSHEAGTFETFDLSAHLALLRPGPNLLAVEVHQDNRTSSDLVWDAELEIDGFSPLLPSGAEGAVDPIGDIPLDVLRVNGSAGGLARSVDVAAGDDLVLDVDSPPGNPVSDLLLLGYFGVPDSSDVIDLGKAGRLVVPPELWLVDTIGYGPVPLLPSYPTPWTYTEPAVTGPIDVALQGAVADASGKLRLTNAILIRVR